jgi:hypothetical protein
VVQKPVNEEALAHWGDVAPKKKDWKLMWKKLR